ncbi:MAG: protease modulator HflK [Phycisphaerae bacterium]|nr:protease modulator HflK [Phycisphaerae bacterium]
MTEQNKDTKDTIINKQYSDQLDAAGKSLSEALRISFVILKIIMIVLVIVFLASGFRVVDPDEKALVLRFGKIQGIGDERLLGPGLHWIFPYPIDKIVKIPVQKKVNLGINSFWHFESDQELESPTKRQVPPSEPLYPTRDGYCITRSEKQSAAIRGVDGSDYNIVHSKWQLIYQIVDPESFFKNVYVEDVEPGQDYFEVITKSINPLLKAVFDDAVVTAMVDYTIDEALSSQEDIRNDVLKLMQQKLTHQINSGIQVESVQLTDITWPRQVDRAFQSLNKASQESEKAISEAKTYAENTLNEAAGSVARRLHATLRDETISEQEKELLWSHAAGAAQTKIAHARAYATKIVENAEANAEYLHKILPEFRKWPELFIQKIHRDAVAEVFDKADEKIMIQPTEGPGAKEIRLIVGGK